LKPTRVQRWSHHDPTANLDRLSNSEHFRGDQLMPNVNGRQAHHTRSDSCGSAPDVIPAIGTVA
jgi:hypothetical protein